MKSTSDYALNLFSTAELNTAKVATRPRFPLRTAIWPVGEKPSRLEKKRGREDPTIHSFIEPGHRGKSLPHSRLMAVGNRAISRFFTFCLFFASLSVGVCESLAANGTAVFLSQKKIEKVKQLAMSNQQPWKKAYDSMVANANDALEMNVQSVTFQGDRSNSYYTQQPYDWSNNKPSPCGKDICDGQINPKADRKDYAAAIAFASGVRALGLGYAFTGKAVYAEKAIKLLNAWCVDPATKMTPTIFKKQAIEQYVTIPGAIYGASLIMDYQGWNRGKKESFLSWVKAFGNAAKADPVPHSDNWESWREVLVASCGALLRDTSMLNNAFGSWKANMPTQISSSGSLPQELGRTNSLFYSTYALCAMTLVAEIAQNNGTDLYGYKANGRNLQMAWDFHAKYVLKPSSWPYRQISKYDYEGVALYELAHAYKSKSAYMNVIKDRGRPMYEGRVLGPATLTHALTGFTTSDEEDTTKQDEGTAPASNSNLIANPGFESGLESWKFHTDGAGSATSSGSSEDGARAVLVATNSKGTNIQLYQNGLQLRPNTDYQLRYAAYSNTGHDLRVSLIKHRSPYTNYGIESENANLTTKWQTFSVNFRTSNFKSGVNDGRLVFWFADDARAGDQYFIDSVKLVEVSAPREPSSPQSPEKKTAKNLISNPSFESGLISWSFYTNGAGSATSSGSSKDGARAALVATNSKGTNIQLYQNGLQLRPNTDYQLRYAAYSNTGHDLRVSLIKHRSPYTNYGIESESANLTTKWQTFSVNFRTSNFKSAVNDGRLVFWFADDARAGDQFLLDQIVLIEK